MKRILYVVFLLFFTASCANAGSPQTASPVRPTLTPTFIPTISESITPIPTETPDPNKPSDATGRDASTGEYTKTVEENGKTSVYVWKQFQFGDDAQNGIRGHWFKSWMENGPVHLTGYGEHCADKWGGDISIDMSVYAVEGQMDLTQIGYLSHPDRESEWNNYGDVSSGGLSCTSVSLSETIMFDLFLRYIGLLPNDSSQNKYKRLNDHYYPDGELTGERAQRFADDRHAFVNAVNNGEMTIHVGEEIWVPQKGYEVYWIDESMAVNDPTMIVSLQAGTTKNYYLKVTAKDGKLIAFIAPAKWLKDQLVRPGDKRERIFRTMLLFPLEAAITSTYPIENASYLPFQEYQGMAGTISGTVNGKSVSIDIPFIGFSSDP